MSVESNTKFKLFHEDLCKHINKLSKQYELDTPAFSTSIKGGTMLMNISTYSEPAYLHYQNLYINNCDSINMSRDWLSLVFRNNSDTKDLKIIGLDQDGGYLCVRLSDSDGKHYHMSPEAVKKLVEGSEGIL